MNNNPENNKNNIDDILDILQKRKSQDIKSNSFSDSAPTRVDNDVVNAKKEVSEVSKTEAKPIHTPDKSSVSEAKTSTAQKSNSPETSSGISLNDFDNIRTQRTPQKNDKKKFRLPRYAKVIIYLVCVFAVSIFISASVIYVANDTFAFVKPDKEITVEIKEGATLGDVANELYEKEVIEYPFIYRIYTKMKLSKSSYYSGSFVAGEHVLNSNLGYDKLLAMLGESKYSTEVVRVTIPEGYTAREIIELFVEKRVVSKENKEAFAEKLNLAIYDYAFLDEFDEIKDENGKVESDRFYLLEGYLFPDTYDFYVGENLDSVVGKLLGNFNKKFEETYYQRSKDLGFTVDEIITIASMIEAEGNKAEDFYKISSVFHNRLKSSSFPFLNSDATTLYSFQGEKKKLDAGDNKSRVHPYNTYLNKGLPPGPICNPGVEAIHAALYPEDTGYYYFYTASSNGVTYFSTNEGQHNTYIQKDKNGTLK